MCTVSYTLYIISINSPFIIISCALFPSFCSSPIILPYFSPFLQFFAAFRFICPFPLLFDHHFSPIPFRFISHFPLLFDNHFSPYPLSFHLPLFPIILSSLFPLSPFASFAPFPYYRIITFSLSPFFFICPFPLLFDHHFFPHPPFASFATFPYYFIITFPPIPFRFICPFPLLFDHHFSPYPLSLHLPLSPIAGVIIVPLYKLVCRVKEKPSRTELQHCFKALISQLVLPKPYFPFHLQRWFCVAATGNHRNVWKTKYKEVQQIKLDYFPF